jgi:S-DNA-T family DNA segregation ATPase FtsK/SpoIIIE
MYTLPPISILNKSPQYDEADQYEQAARAGEQIVEKLDQLGMRCEIDDIKIGPQVISYYCIAAEKVAVRKIPSLLPELQYELGCATIAIHAPQAGCKYVVIEVNNPHRRTIFTGDVINHAYSPLEFPLGVDPTNCVISQDIRAMPHLLIAGTTGAGKSVGLHSMICSLLCATTPDELLFHMVDSKMTELTMYEGIPNLLTPVVTDAFEAVSHFNALVSMMEYRYELSQEYGARDLNELNEKLPEKLPYILVVVDEIADLIFISKHEIEESIVRIAQKSRAVGIHLVFATQSPRREIITGLLKANLPSRIAYSTSSELDSRIILDKNGAGSLTGLGDCLYSRQGRAPIRLQSPYISSKEISSVVDHCKSQNSHLKIAA